MNRVYYFARRIVSVIALAMLVSAGWPQLGHAQPAGIDPQAEKLLKRMSDYLARRQHFRSDRFGNRLGDAGVGRMAAAWPCATCRDRSAGRKIVETHERLPCGPPAVHCESGEHARSRTHVRAEDPV